MKTKKFLKWLPMLALAAIMAAGCGDGTDPQDTPPPKNEWQEVNAISVDEQTEKWLDSIFINIDNVVDIKKIIDTVYDYKNAAFVINGKEELKQIYVDNFEPDIDFSKYVLVGGFAEMLSWPPKTVNIKLFVNDSLQAYKCEVTVTTGATYGGTGTFYFGNIFPKLNAKYDMFLNINWTRG